MIRSGGLLLALALVGCDASGSAQGGAPRNPDPCADPGLGHTWTDLYACYFGPAGKGSCVSQAFCHGSLAQTGALYPASWICGASRESCWQGMHRPTPDGNAMVCVDVAVDGGPDADAAAGDSGAIDAGQSDAAEAAEASAPMVCVVPTGAPQSTRLWGSLRGADGIGLHNMPYSPLAPPGGVTFTPQDLDRISAWIREGAQDN